MGFSSFMFLFCFLGYSFYERNTLSDSVSELNVNYLYGLLKYLSLKYATRFGFLLVFAPLGAYYIIKDTSNTNYFLYVILTSYSLVFYDTSYPLLTLMPFLSIITVKGLFSVFTQINFKQSTIHFSIIALVVFSAISPEFFVFNTKEPPVPGIEHSKTEEQILARNVAFYIEKEAKYPMVHNLVGGSYILAFTEIPMHRSDLYIPTYSSEDRWVARDIMKVLTAEEGFDTFLEDVGPASFSLQHGVLLLGEDKDNEKIKLEIRRLTNYNATSFIVATYAPIPTMVKAENGEFVESVFLRSVHEESYTIYLADYHRFYFLNYDE